MVDPGQRDVVVAERSVSLVPRREVTAEGLVLPASLVTAAAAMQAALLEKIADAGLPAPKGDEIRDRVLQLTRFIPAGEAQQIVLTVRDRPPYFGATTRRVRG